MYETTYRTNVASIEGVNAQLPTSLTPNQIIVIPVNQKSITAVPLFAALPVSESNTTIEKMAAILAASDLNDFLLYNAFDTTCRNFSGWVLAPRSSTATATPTFIPATPSMTATFPTPTLPRNPTRVAACGHPLDESFGIGRQFLIHRVQAGDTLAMYETTYRTNVAAIETVNAQPLIPLRTNQVIVIPVDQGAVDAVPLFEAFPVYENNTTNERIAFMLAASDLNAFLQYNAINTTCPFFSGWVLAPRSRPGITATPEPDARPTFRPKNDSQ